MENKKEILSKIPIAIMPALIGLCTLSNIYLLFGFTWIRHVSMVTSIVVLIVYLLKIGIAFKTVKKEYLATVPSSLYASIAMLTMIVSSYIFGFSPKFGKIIWFIAIIVHTIHILVFTYMNVIKKFSMETFMPSWFVTYNGIMVSAVVGNIMNEPFLMKIVVYYGLVIFCIIMPFIIYRLAAHPIKDELYHAQAIVLAPASLCVVSYINTFEYPSAIILYSLYVIVLFALAFVLYKLPDFFEYEFTPGFAALTFPMAIGTLASVKMSAFLKLQGYGKLALIIKELSGIQLLITTGIISFVLFNFVTFLRESFMEG